MTQLIARRNLLRGTVAAALIGLPSVSNGQANAYRIVASGLMAPESPKPQRDGTILVCEMARGTLSRVSPNGAIERVAELGGSPNGVAIGPDGAAYVCNNGGMNFRHEGGLTIPSGPPLDNPGSIQRVDLKTGAFSVLISQFDGRRLHGPNDLVFDGRGGFWFTDISLPSADGQVKGALLWANLDGSDVRRVADVPAANGIALSPDRRTVYVAETMEHQILAFSTIGIGAVAKGPDGRAKVQRILKRDDKVGFDSMAVEADGGVVIGTLGEGSLTEFGPDGLRRGVVLLPDNLVTSIGFGGPNLRTAYVSLTTTGRIAAVSWPRPGLPLAYP